MYNIFTRKSEIAVTKAPASDTQTPQEKARSLSRCSNADARRLLEYQQAERLQSLPIAIFNVLGRKVLTVAVATNSSLELAAALKFSTGYEVKLIQVEAETLKQAIYIAYKGDPLALVKGIAQLQVAPKIKLASDSTPSIRSTSGDVSKFFEALVDYAIAQAASDIHICPKLDGTYLKIRVNGEILSHEAAIASTAQHLQLVNRIKVLAGLDTTQRSLPQDGSLIVPIDERQVHLRVSTLSTIHGEKVVLRILSAEGVKALSNLGFSSPSLKLLNRHLDKAEGMILFAGATGSGKTTSMYSALQELQQKNISICTIEDPVEIHISGISQTSIDEKSGLTYGKALRALLRQDPDVIMMGEIRDSDSASVALQAAMTGHLLISTVHARNAYEVISRLQNLGVDTLSIIQALNLVVCQKLVPLLCENCKVVDLQVSNATNHESYKAVGCNHCDYSGYIGQKLEVEMLEIDEKVSTAILNKTINNIAI